MHKLNAHVTLFNDVQHLYTDSDPSEEKKKKKKVIKQHSLQHNSIAHLVLENPYDILVVKIYDICYPFELASEMIKEEGPE